MQNTTTTKNIEQRQRSNSWSTIIHTQKLWTVINVFLTKNSYSYIARTLEVIVKIVFLKRLCKLGSKNSERTWL